MNTKEQQQLLLKIVIGAAWVDGHLETQEVEYLEKLLHKYNLSHDSELLLLLSQPVAIEATENWIISYLASSTDTERMRLLSAIADILIADRTVSEIEHELLDEYHALMAKIPSHREATPSSIEIIGRFVRQLIHIIQKTIFAKENKKLNPS